MRRVGHHQVAIERATRLVHELGDRAQHDRADRHRRDEVAVADVEMEDPRARLERGPELIPEARKIGRAERRLNLHLTADAVPPPHRAILRRSRACTRSWGDEETGGAVDVAASEELGPLGVAELRPFVGERRVRLQPGRLDDGLGLVAVDRAHRVDDRAAGPDAPGGAEQELQLGREAGASASVGRDGPRGRPTPSTARRRAPGRSPSAPPAALGRQRGARGFAARDAAGSPPAHVHGPR